MDNLKLRGVVLGHLATVVSLGVGGESVLHVPLLHLSDDHNPLVPMWRSS